MISGKVVNLHRRAAMALDSFTAREQVQVKKSIDRLVNQSSGSSPVGTRRISSGEPLYVMRVAPGIRAIFRKTTAGIVVENLVRKQTLSSFNSEKRAGKAPKRTGEL